MRIKLLIAAQDSDYAEHLSNVLSEKHADAFEVSVCSSVERVADVLRSNKYDVILVEPALIAGISKDSAPLSLVLWDGVEFAEDQSGLRRIRKYQRVSSIAGCVLEGFAEISGNGGNSGFDSKNARITAVWSPAGGVGKTTAALAYCTRKVSEGKQVLYLSLEHFSSVSVYFSRDGKSISTVFDKLENNAHMLLRGIRQQDSGSGIMYFCEPENYDDINVLTDQDIAALAGACSIGVDELVIDLPSACDARTQQIFNMADAVFLVCDATKTAQMKLRQFMEQHSIAQQINAKAILIGNKGVKLNEARISKFVQLPYVQSNDSIVVYKTLSGHSFER